MAETGLLGVLKEALLLSDRYEMRARLLPGMFAVVPLAVAAYAVAASSMGTLSSVGIAMSVEILLMLFAGHLSRVLGTGYEQRLFGGRLPTTVWLSDESPRSKQQREQWAGAIKQLTGLDIQKGSCEERIRTVSDALAQLRAILRGDPAASMVQLHNEDYGFARNLAGLVPVWLGVSIAGFLVCAGAAILTEVSWLPAAIEMTLVVAAGAYGFLRRRAVTWAADRYAVSVLAAALMVAGRQT